MFSFFRITVCAYGLPVSDVLPVYSSEVFFPFLSFPFSESKLCCYGLVSGFIRVMKYWNYSELCNQSYSIYNRVRAELTRYSLLSYQKLQNRPVVRVLHNGNNHTDTIEPLILFGTSVSLNSPGLLFSVLLP